MSIRTIADYNQWLAENAEKFEALSDTIRILRDDRGVAETQAMAEAAIIVASLDPDRVTSLLIAAALLKSREVQS